MLENFRDKPVLISFSSAYCGPCKLQRKELLSAQKDLQFSVVVIDTDRWPHVGSRFKVAKLPCLVGLRDGEVLLRLEGLRSADEIIESFNTALK